MFNEKKRGKRKDKRDLEKVRNDVATKKREERQRECIPSSPKKTHAHAL